VRAFRDEVIARDVRIVGVAEYGAPDLFAVAARGQYL